MTPYYITFLIPFLIGVVLGLLIALLLRLIQAKTARELAEELYAENEKRRNEYINQIMDYMKASFSHLSFDALSRSTTEFLKLAHSKLESERELNVKELDEKKELIEFQLKRMTVELEQASMLMRDLERDRVDKFSQLAHQLKITNEQTSTLTRSTQNLNEILSNTKIRGQWGERMAEDVLRLAGFIENINYIKQKTIANSGPRPDFTFFLPRELKLHMDVKFPMNNYLRYLEAESSVDREKFRIDFLKDVKLRIKEVTSREYIDPNQQTVDYVLLFIPNEQIYAFIHEQDPSILDEGLKNHVVFCSPITLYAVLAVIRQAVDNFSLEQTSNEILSLIGSFKKQWFEFVKKMDNLGKKIEEAQKEYEQLTSTRRRQLEKPLNKLEVLRTQRRLPLDTLSTPDQEALDLDEPSADDEGSNDDAGPA
ncbi:DNA recombination protein RmuC [candidate division KSB1 bacterium]|nr:DNA recombination protein RmuC [candidate division KSB1 bacterium]